VDVLCNDCVPAWWQGERVGADLTGRFYQDPRKTAVDDRAIQLALSGRSRVVDTSLRWRLNRLKTNWKFARGG
jgi:hypothetical protein